MSNQCANSNILSSSNSKIRFFNEPIELIDNYMCDSPQILTHGSGCGLGWFTLDQCLEVVTCLSLVSGALKPTRHKIVVLQDFGSIPYDTVCDIPIIECDNPFIIPSPSP